jgi:ATP/ADP translocase
MMAPEPETKEIMKGLVLFILISFITSNIVEPRSWVILASVLFGY